MLARVVTATNESVRLCRVKKIEIIDIPID